MARGQSSTSPDAKPKTRQNKKKSGKNQESQKPFKLKPEPKPTVKEQKQAAKAVANDKEEMERRRNAIFPTWNSITQAIWQKIHDKGIDDPSITVDDINNVYACATEMGADYSGPAGKKLLIQHVKAWQDSPAVKEDLMYFTKHFAAYIDKRVDKRIEEKYVEVEQSLSEKFEPRIDDITNRLENLEKQNYRLKKGLSSFQKVQREIIVFDPDPAWDPKAKQEDLKTSAAKLLSDIKTVGNLSPDDITFVNPIQESRKKEKRFAITLSTIHLKQEIIKKVSADEKFPFKIREGTTKEEREMKVEKFPFATAAHMFNYESQVKGEPVLARCEQDRKTGKFKVVKYEQSQPEVSEIFQRVKNNELTQPPGWEDKFRVHIE